MAADTKTKTVSEETRRKMSEAHTGMVRSEETRRKIAAARRGKPMSDETRRKISEARTGQKHTQATREKMSRAQKGRTVSEETRRKIRIAQERRERPELARGGKHPWARRINQLTPDGELVRTWDCKADIMKDPRFPSAYLLRECCKGNRAEYNGYRWEYAD